MKWLKSEVTSVKMIKKNVVQAGQNQGYNRSRSGAGWHLILGLPDRRRQRVMPGYRRSGHVHLVQFTAEAHKHVCKHCMTSL